MKICVPYAHNLTKLGNQRRPRLWAGPGTQTSWDGKWERDFLGWGPAGKIYQELKYPGRWVRLADYWYTVISPHAGAPHPAREGL
jgi:hypothetical protein